MDGLDRMLTAAEIVLGVALLCVAMVLSFAGTRIPPIAVWGTLAIALVLMRVVVRPLITGSRSQRS